MSKNRPFVLTIAGFDPSGNLEILTNVKTFEQHCVSGFTINIGDTIQTKNEFFKMY
jgi:hydroxymethylpyrimidine/phosphomethylpyrimidine kinase